MRTDIPTLKRIVVESVTIVGSILLAFAIDAWWEKRTETAQLVDLLMAIEAELTANDEWFQEQIESTFEQIQAADRVLASLASDDTELDSDTVLKDLGAAVNYSSGMEGGITSIDALVNSDLYGTVSKPDWTSTLSNYVYHANWLTSHAQNEWATYRSSLQPVLGKSIDMRGLNWQLYDRLARPNGEFVLKSANLPHSSDLSGLKSPEARNAIYAWLALLMDRYRGYETTKKNGEQLREIIRAEIERIS